MKKIIWLSVPVVVLLGTFFGIRAYYTNLAHGYAYRLEGSVERCNSSLLEKRDLRYPSIFSHLRQDREAFAALPQWAVSSAAKERFAAAAAAGERAATATNLAIEAAKQREKDRVEERVRTAKAEEIARREAREKEAVKEAEARRKAEAQLAKVAAVVEGAHRAGAHRAGAATPQANADWPLSDPWPSDLKPTKLLIWNQNKKQVDSANSALSDGLRGTPHDAELLICSVVKEHLQEVVQYKQSFEQLGGAGAPAGFISGTIPGYRMWQSVRLVRYPSGERIGAYTIVGDSPSREAYVASDPDKRKTIVGDYQPTLARWLESRCAPAGPFEKFLRTADAAEASGYVGDIEKKWDTIGPPALPYLAKLLRTTSDPDRQYYLVRLVQIVEHEPNNYIEGNLPGRPPAPARIGPANWDMFRANPALWVGRVRSWLRQQVPE